MDGHEGYKATVSREVVVNHPSWNILGRQILFLSGFFFDQKVLSTKNTIQKSELHTDDITFYGKETARKWHKNDRVFADNAIHERRSYE